MQLDESAQLDASVGTTKDVFEELLSHQLLLQLFGSISEVSLVIAGRSPVSWWPPGGLAQKRSSSSSTAAVGSTGTTPAPMSPMHAAPAAAAAADGTGSGPGRSMLASAAVQALAAAAQGAQPAAGSAGARPGLLVSLEEEVDLVAIKFQGAQVSMTISGDGFSTEVAMAALTIDDLLVGARNPGKAHMARSSIVWEQKQQQKQQDLQHQQQVPAVPQAAPPPPTQQQQKPVAEGPGATGWSHT
jgi:hypothetical protein